MLKARGMDFCAELSLALFTLCDIFTCPVCFLSEKPNRFSLDVNTRPRGKIQIPAVSAPRDGKLSFAHFCISFITSRRKNAYGIVGRIRECPGARLVVFSSPSNRAPGFRVFDFSIRRARRRGYFITCTARCIVSGDRLIRSPVCYVTAHTCWYRADFRCHRGCFYSFTITTE